VHRLTLIVLQGCLSQLVTGQVPSDANIDERASTTSKVYSLVQLYFFSAKEESDPRLDVSYKSYLRTVLASDDRHQFDLATMEFVAQLHNGHTFFWDAANPDFGGVVACDFHARSRMLV
jgi:hypothetical protein